MKTSDAVVSQSVISAKVKRCEYRHKWAGSHLPDCVSRHGFKTDCSCIPGLHCEKCGHRPGAKELQEAEAIVHLREVLKPGDTVYTVLRHVSRSGMSRNIDVYYMAGGEPQWISAYVGHAIRSPQSRKNWERSQGLTVGGCGMDMGFHIVYSLSHVLFPDGFGVECELCHKRPHSKQEAEDATADKKRTSCPVKEPFRHQYWGRNADKSGWDDDGGYALNHKWL